MSKKTGETITLTAKRYRDTKEEDSQITFRIDGHLQLSDAEGYPNGLLEHFKNFALALGYHPNCVDRIVYLQENEMVVEKELSKIEDRVRVGDIVDILRADDATLAEKMLDNEQYVRDFATEVKRYRNK